MLKRMLGALGHKRPEDGDADAAPSARAGDAQFITACDSYGREIRIRRSAWRDNVLLPGLEQAWNDPEALYAQLVDALDNGFAGELDAASTRLLAIDPTPQRAQAVRSIVLMDSTRRSDPARGRRRGANGAPPAPRCGETDTVGIDRPVWTYGLRNPTWLIAEKPVDAPLVTFVGFARRFPPPDASQDDRDDDIGSLSRSAALYLAEAVHQWTGLRTSTVLAVVDGAGPAVLEADELHAGLCARFGEQSAYVVSGEVDCGSHGWRIACRLWDCANGTRLAEETVEAPAGQAGAAVLELERRLLARLGTVRGTPVDGFYARPPPQAMAPYLAALGHGFMLTLAANGIMSQDLLPHERTMLEWPLGLARQWPQAEVPTLMFLSGLAKAAAYGSGVLHEFDARAIELMREARLADSALAGLEPLALQVFGRRNELARRHSEPGPDTPDAYRQWLARCIAHADDGERAAGSASRSADAGWREEP